jgi:hypothetical protein
MMEGNIWLLVAVNTIIPTEKEMQGKAETLQFGGESGSREGWEALHLGGGMPKGSLLGRGRAGQSGQQIQHWERVAKLTMDKSLARTCQVDKGCHAEPQGRDEATEGPPQLGTQGG